MRLSTRGRYGCRAMLDLALAETDEPINLKEIAAHQDLSVDYLEQLLRKLRKAGLVKSVRGPRGGFLLARPAAEISLWDVVRALEEEVAPVFCVDQYVIDGPPKKRCPRSRRCATHRLWAGLAKQIQTYLQGKTLLDLADDFKRLAEEEVPGDCIVYDI